MNKRGRKLGHPVSEETKKKISKTMKGMKFSNQHKVRIGVSMRKFHKKPKKEKLERQLRLIQEQLKQIKETEENKNE